MKKRKFLTDSRFVYPFLLLNLFSVGGSIILHSYHYHTPSRIINITALSLVLIYIFILKRMKKE